MIPENKIERYDINPFEAAKKEFLEETGTFY